MVTPEPAKAGDQAIHMDEHPSPNQAGLAQSEQWDQDVMQRLMDVSLGIAAAGHDLKNLLTVAYANIQIATTEMTVVPRELTSGMQAISGATTLLHHLTQRGSNSDTGYSSDVPVVVQETLLFSRVLWTHIQDLVVTTEVQAIPRAAIRAHDLQRILLNLILNAARAMPNGGHLQISMTFDGSMVAVTVQDSGPGMDAVTLRAIRQPFAEQRAEGVGLGLASCRLLIEQAHGQMEIASVLGAGTSVTLRIPAAGYSTALN